MASPTQRAWIWENSRRQWRTEEPAVLQSTRSQRVRHNWATEQQQEIRLREVKPSAQGHIAFKWQRQDWNPGSSHFWICLGDFAFPRKPHYVSNKPFIRCFLCGASSSISVSEPASIDEGWGAYPSHLLAVDYKHEKVNLCISNKRASLVAQW